MKIDSSIVSAIKNYISDKNMLFQDFAVELGISKAAVTKWSRVGNGITDAKWQLLFPKIKKYLPKERIYIDDSGAERYLSATEHISDYVFEPQYVPAMVHLIPLSELNKYDNVIESVSQFGFRMGAELVEYHPKHSEKTGVMAVKITDNLYSPVLPKNSTLFICTGNASIPNGCLSVVKDKSGEVMIGNYRMKNDQFAVTDLVNDKPLVIGGIGRARNVIEWIFPVLYYEVKTF